jgi:hypothetical protein
MEPKSFAEPAMSKCGCPRLPSVAIWIVVVLGLGGKVNNYQTTSFETNQSL